MRFHDTFIVIHSVLSHPYYNFIISESQCRGLLHQLSYRQPAFQTRKHLMKFSYFPFTAFSKFFSSFIHPLLGNHSWSLLSSHPNTFSSNPPSHLSIPIILLRMENSQTIIHQHLCLTDQSQSAARFPNSPSVPPFVVPLFMRHSFIPMVLFVFSYPLLYICLLFLWLPPISAMDQSHK